MSEPENFEELHLWLEQLTAHAGFPVRPADEDAWQLCTVGGAHIWLIQYEAPHVASIETAAEDIGIHGESVFADLPPPADGLLRLRIMQSADLIEGLLTTPEAPFAYPPEPLRELARWLLVDWWKQRGQLRAATTLFVEHEASRSRLDSEES